MPSHDLTLFRDEYDRDDLFRMLNDDKLRSWNRKHYYFYDAENNLYMVFNNERDARISFTIKDYIHGYMLHMRNPPPFTSALGLGPLMFLSMEMFNVSGYTAWVSEARYGILANNPPNELVISPLRASPTTVLSSAIPNINPPPRLCNPVQHIIKIS